MTTNFNYKTPQKRMSKMEIDQIMNGLRNNLLYSLQQRRSEVFKLKT